MAEQQDTSLSMERKFGLGCLYYVMERRYPFILLKIQEQFDESHPTAREINEEEFQNHLSRFSKVYEAVYSQAANHLIMMEAEYSSFFENRDEAHFENFVELLSNYEKDIRDKPLNNEDLIDFCARISAFACMSLVANHSKEVLLHAADSIASLMTYYEFDDAKERTFGLGCVQCVMQQRYPDLLLDIRKRLDKSLLRHCEGNEEEFTDHLSRFSRVYEAVNAQAANHIRVIEAEYRSFFNKRDEIHFENFVELLSNYEIDIREKSFNNEDLIDFCAHISVFVCMSLVKHLRKEVLLYAVDSIASLMTYYKFDDAKYNELVKFAENSS
ncbi:hypothetical protein HNY73_009141 [Argiope bruennichi]|uniref:Uncharacterized protein n=1 Tax=Argiope bruennichi TaxID=94029 RepID=A0A8T0FBB5_ARGBR|nr:hypothetical protein HNY73_009141 [Argiope bruennichi]